jgi:hypothetical protein
MAMKEKASNMSGFRDSVGMVYEWDDSFGLAPWIGINLAVDQL